MRVTEDDLRAHRNQLVYKEEPALVHLFVDDDRALGLGGCDQGDAHQVGRERGPRRIVDLGHRAAEIGANVQILTVFDDQGVAFVRRRVGRFLHMHAHTQPVDKDHLHHAQVFGHHADDAQLAGRDGAQADVAADLDIIGADVCFAAVQPFLAVDDQRVAADAFDGAAHARQHPAEILHVRLAGGVAQDRSAVGQGGSHDAVLRGRNRRLVEQNVAAHQPAVGDQLEFAVVVHGHAEAAENLKMRVDAPAANVVAARGGVHQEAA